jgi:hypothetical protein
MLFGRSVTVRLPDSGVTVEVGPGGPSHCKSTPEPDQQAHPSAVKTYQRPRTCWSIWGAAIKLASRRSRSPWVLPPSGVVRTESHPCVRIGKNGLEWPPGLRTSPNPTLKVRIGQNLDAVGRTEGSGAPGRAPDRSSRQQSLQSCQQCRPCGKWLIWSGGSRCAALIASALSADDAPSG